MRLQLLREKVLSEYDIVDNTSNIELNEEFNITEFNDDLLSEFNKTKKLEGCSKNTLKLYNSEVKNLIKYLDKNIVKITTDDIKDYLLYKKEVCGVSNITLDNIKFNDGEVADAKYVTIAEFKNMLKNNEIKELPIATEGGNVNCYKLTLTRGTELAADVLKNKANIEYIAAMNDVEL